MRSPLRRVNRACHAAPSHPCRTSTATTRIAGDGTGEIHGQPNGWRKLWTGHPAKDWTSGCVALTDREMREVWSRVQIGARVLIHP